MSSNSNNERNNTPSSHRAKANKAARIAFASAAAVREGQDAGAPRAAGLVPLADYRAPGMPAEHVVRAMWRRIKDRFSPSESDPVRADNRLQATTVKLLDEVAGQPACGPLLDDLDAAMRAWVDEPHGSFHCVVVLPPCDAADLIGGWARSRGHAVLCAPDRDRGHALSVVQGGGEAPGARKAPASRADHATGNDCLVPGTPSSLLVIPRLESWFLRRRNGLLAVRALLAELQQSERRCLIGCNSWAWAFLVRAAGASLVLPSPRTFGAFDAKRLQAWFAELGAASSQPGRVAFRLAHSGADVLATEGDGALANNYLEELAARSHGIPWVAWHLWRNGLRTGIDAVETQKANGHAVNKVSESAAHASQVVADARHEAGKILEKIIPPGERTFWITGVPDPDLPHHQDDNALLVLHALLIHGALDTAELLSVLPDATAAEVLPALLRAGFLEQQGSQLVVKPSAYPAVRRALLADGFPIGAL